MFRYKNLQDILFLHKMFFKLKKKLSIVHFVTLTIKQFSTFVMVN